MKHFLSTLMLLSPFALFATDYKLDETKSTIGFEIIKFKIGAPVEGKFKNFSGTISYDSKKQQIEKVNVAIKIASIDTGIKQRDDHLMTDDFFSEKKFPLMTFVSDTPVKLADHFKLSGVLTIKSTKKNVVLDVEKVSQENGLAHYKATTKVNRLDYGVTWNSALEQGQKVTVLGKIGTMVLDDEVTVKLDLFTLK